MCQFKPTKKEVKLRLDLPIEEARFTSIPRDEPIIAWKIFRLLDKGRENGKLRPAFSISSGVNFQFNTYGYSNTEANRDINYQMNLAVELYNQIVQVKYPGGFFSFKKRTDAAAYLCTITHLHPEFKQTYKLRKVLLLDVLGEHKTANDGIVYTSKIFYIFPESEEAI